MCVTVTEWDQDGPEKERLPLREPSLNKKKVKKTPQQNMNFTVKCQYSVQTKLYFQSHAAILC